MLSRLVHLEKDQHVTMYRANALDSPNQIFFVLVMSSCVQYEVE